MGNYSLTNMEDLPPLQHSDIVPPLYREVYTRLKTHVDASAGHPGTHIAVLGNTYSGRDLLVSRIAEDYPDAAFHTLTSPVTDVASELGSYDGVPFLFLRNAQFLATPRIGGFDPLESFQAFLAGTKTSVISGWNTSAWNYYAAVTGIDAYQHRVVEIPPFTAGQLKTAIHDHYGETIGYVNDATLRSAFFDTAMTRKVAIPFTQHRIAIPWFFFDPNILASVVNRQDKNANPENAVFLRLTRIAQGNSGVAAALWNASLQYPEIRISGIRDPPVVERLSIDERHVLAVILMLESASPDELFGILGKETGQVLYLLRSRGIIEDVEGRVRIRLIMANSVLHYLRRMRMVT